MPDVIDLGARELLELYRRRAVSPVGVVEALAARIDAVDGVVGAFTTTSVERALAEAREAERTWRLGSPRLLEGVPIGVKDLFDTEGVRTTYGSPMFAQHVPARDAEAVRRARAAGAILLGKTQTHEFAWGITSLNEAMGSTRNPWALDRISGGSSGGSAVALAARECPLTLGSDTGGSIRVPAAFCGIVGLKTTHGRIPLSGAWPLAPSLDHPGPMARTPADCALLLSVLAGVHPEDAWSSRAPLGDVEGELHRGLAGLTVGVSGDLAVVPLAPDVQVAFDAATAAVRDAGARVVEVELPELANVFATFGAIQRAEALHVHVEAGLWPDRRGEYGADVRGRLELAEGETLAGYLAASRERQRLRAGFARALAACDVLLSPVGAGSPAPLGAERVAHRGAEIEFRELVMSFTTPQDLTGLPACTVRAGFDALGVPVGVQFTGAPWAEATVLRAAQGLWDATRPLQDRWPEP